MTNENLTARDVIARVLAEASDDRAWVTERSETMLAALAAAGYTIVTTDAIGSTSDGFHTFDELYEFRLLLHAHAVRAWVADGIPVVRSWRHHDGEECFGGGWFIVTAQLPTGQVSNHYPAADWVLFDGVRAVPTAPEWDGHGTKDVADRLRAALGGGS